MIRPSPPLLSSTICRNCKMHRDDTGNTFGWGLCECGSFRRSVVVAGQQMPQGAGHGDAAVQNSPRIGENEGVEL